MECLKFMKDVFTNSLSFYTETILSNFMSAYKNPIVQIMSY